ncbi:phenylalanine ammonia-lyase [Puccinia sorghi]|uniref:Phenylalanine ammonia-lyase n=1 Tax=Puccinia sorghi TaxID=27349 RepID=A0A0L6VFU5_9BASI|nr:phenylalanine ammonia-lyase [Puccinia sorghi]
MNKGFPLELDRFCAAYLSELQYLTEHVKTHFQISKGHNQALKSLAIMSARKTLDEIEISKMLVISPMKIKLPGNPPIIFETLPTWFKTFIQLILTNLVNLNHLLQPLNIHLTPHI